MLKEKIIILLTGIAIATFGAWPTYHGNVSLSGISECELPEKPELLWRYNAGGEVYNTPVSDGERIYFSAKKGQVVALDLNGSNVWKKTFTRINDAGQEIAVRFEASLVCDEGFVFAGSTRGTLYALDAKTGAEKWKYETGGIIAASPNLIESERNDAKAQHEKRCSASASSRLKYPAIVVLDQSAGALHCIDVLTGKLRWKSEEVERCDGAPGVGVGRIVFGSCLAALHVYSLEGLHLKDIEVGGDGQIAGGVAVDGRQAFAGARAGGMLCFDLEKGTVLWSSNESKEQTFSTPAVTDDRVVYSSNDGFVYAAHRTDGALVWKFDTGGLPYSSIISADKVVVSADGILFLLNLTDGAKLWAKEISDDITSPAIIDGMVVVGTDDGTVTAFGSKK